LAPAPSDADAGVAGVRPKAARRTTKERDAQIAELLKDPKKTSRQIAAIVGVTLKTVVRARKKARIAERKARHKRQRDKPWIAPAGDVTDTQLDSNLVEPEPKSDLTVEPPNVAGEGAVGARAEAASVAPKSVPAPEVEQREPKAAAKEPNTQQIQPATAEDLRNRETVKQLALRIWARMVAGKVLSEMSGLLDELIKSPLLDDDDEEVDEDWPDNHHKREKKLLDEAIADALENYSDIDSINDLPPSSDPDVAQHAEQLKVYLAKCSIGATEFKEEFPRTIIERMVKIEIESQFKKRPKYSEHIPADVPGRDIKKYGKQRRTSSAGTFYKTVEYLDGDGLAALLTNGWTRGAKERIEPVARSYRYGFARKSEQQSWQHHFLIIERSGKESPFKLPLEKLAGKGAPAIQSLMKSGVHVIAGDDAQKALVQFLRFKSKQEIGIAQYKLCARCGRDPARAAHCRDHSGVGGGNRRAAPGQFQRRVVARHLLGSAVVGPRE
jgi:hypothetical protein